MRVYIAGPMTKGDQAVNVRNGIDAATKVLMAGHAPYLPHLTHFWHLVAPQKHDVWMKLDFAFLAQCHAMIRLPGESDGADQEVMFAARLNIPIYASIEEFLSACPLGR